MPRRDDAASLLFLFAYKSFWIEINRPFLILKVVDKNLEA